MSKILFENHDVECGFIIIDECNNDYYYFEYDILEDVDGIQENEEQLYLTREANICSFEIANFDAGNTNIEELIDIIEQIGYNKCLIRDSAIARDELDLIIQGLY